MPAPETLNLDEDTSKFLKHTQEEKDAETQSQVRADHDLSQLQVAGIKDISPVAANTTSNPHTSTTSSPCSTKAKIDGFLEM